MRARLFTLGLLLSTSAPAQQVITTFAGTDWVFTDDGKPGVNATIAQPVAVLPTRAATSTSPTRR